MIEYDLKAMKPSQERRLKSSIKTDEGRNRFVKELGTFLSTEPAGGEAELDQTRSLATRLTAIGLWDELPAEQLDEISKTGNSERIEAFRMGMPTDVASKLPRRQRTRVTRAPSRGGKRDELIAKYAEDLRRKVGVEPDMDLLTKITISCGPAIYQRDQATIAATQSDELERVKSNFLVSKLGLPDSPKLMDWVNSVIDEYGRSEQHKYRAVIYYLLVDRLSHEESIVKWVREHSTEEKPAQRWLIRS